MSFKGIHLLGLVGVGAILLLLLVLVAPASATTAKDYIR